MQSPAHRALHRFWQSISGKIGLVLTILLVLLAVLAPILHPYSPSTEQNVAERLLAPAATHWFGTDGRGRDLLILVWYGTRTSLAISVVSVGLGLSAGLFLGLVAGYFRGWMETVIGWLTDILLAFPSILLAIAIVTVSGPNLQNTMIAVGIVQIPVFTRLTRAMVLTLKQQEFVQAVQALGAVPSRVLLFHILPASLAPIVVQATLSIGTATLEAAGLGFLGLGAQPPMPELGTMLSDAFNEGYSLTKPWTTMFPGLVITLIVLAFNLLGDGLQDALDTRGNQ
jgi:peptide/nickel transport system permease protein